MKINKKSNKRKTIKRKTNKRKTIKRKTDKLSRKDYENILSRYGLSTVGTVEMLRDRTEMALGVKMCRCLKSVSKQTKRSESDIFGICSNAVLTQKGVKSKQITCSKKRLAQGLTKTRRRRR